MKTLRLFLIAAFVISGSSALAQRDDTGQPTKQSQRQKTKARSQPQAQPAPPPEGAVPVEPAPSQVVGAPIGQPTFVVPAPQVTIQAPPVAVAPAPKPSVGIINIGQSFNETLAPYVNDIVNAVLLALIGLVANWWRQKTGTDIDKNLREGVTRALQNQAGSLLAAGAAKMDGIKIDVKDADLANAANDLLRSVPDAAKRFGLTPEKVAQRILDTIPQTPAGAALVAGAHSPVVVINDPGRPQTLPATI